MNVDAVPERFRPLLAEVVSRIAAGDYDGLARDFIAHADESDYDLGLWARGYPAAFTPLPPEAWTYADAFYIRSAITGTSCWICGLRRRVVAT
jgi:hypothetical protein